MPDIWFASPGDPETLTGGYIYNARVISELRAAGLDVCPLRLPDGFPNPLPEDHQTAERLLARVCKDDLVVIDGLALGAMDPACLEAVSGKIVALVHHPLADESGLSTEDASRLEQSERAALTFAERVIVTSPHTRDALVTRFGVAPDKISVALPGVDRSELPRTPAEPPLVLSVGSVTARKGHDVLVAALALIAELDWQATIVGSLERDDTAVGQVRDLIDRHGMQGRVTLAGELSSDDLSELYRKASVFALATRHEGYGMVFSEAMIRGLPIVSCAAGAVPDTVPPEAGLLVPADDEHVFAGALESLLRDVALRASYSEGSLRCGTQLPTWDDTAAVFTTVFQEVQRS